MKALLAIPAFLLALPVLVLVGIALGPVMLLIAWALLCVAPFLLAAAVGVRLDQAWLHHKRGRIAR